MDSFSVTRIVPRLRRTNAATSEGTEHRRALNIAVSIRFCRCRPVDARVERKHVFGLLDELDAAA